MFCPNCGAESTGGLNYCKRCGESLVIRQESSGPLPQPIKLGGLYWAIAVTTIFSLSLLVGGAISLVALGVRDDDTIVALMFFGSLTIFGIVAMLIRQVSRLISASAQKSPARPKKAIPAHEPPLLEAPPEGTPSVTEHTTRRFRKSSYEKQG